MDAFQMLSLLYPSQCREEGGGERRKVHLLLPRHRQVSPMSAAYESVLLKPSQQVTPHCIAVI